MNNSQGPTILPTIHLNGNSAESLFNDYHTAVRAVDAAIKAVRKIDLHGRNYYPQGSDAYGKAYAEHQDRVLHPLQNALTYLETIATHCNDHRRKGK